ETVCRATSCDMEIAPTTKRTPSVAGVSIPPVVINRDCVQSKVVRYGNRTYDETRTIRSGGFHTAGSERQLHLPAAVSIPPDGVGNQTFIHQEVQIDEYPTVLCSRRHRLYYAGGSWPPADLPARTAHSALAI